MLEQKDQPSKDVTMTTPPQNVTPLEGIRQKVFMDRYSLKDANGNPLEFHPEQLWARVARGIAAVEQTEEKREEWEKLFYEALTNFQFVPGGRILAGAGTGHQVTYYNCFVVPSPEDSRQGILDNLKIMTEIMARGGGVGINLSTLRPRGSYIKTVNGTASGPCSWAQLYSVATGDVIQQGGCFGPDERIATDRGLIPAKELADRLDSGEVIQAQTHKGLRPFTAVFRNGTKDLYEVTTSRGCHVRVTLDHKMGVLRHGEITTIPLRELEKGSEILLLLGGDAKSEAELGVLPDAIVSITPLGPSQVYDFEVDEVHMLSAGGIYSSNSRRGALMLMLDDTHPDIEEFITVKREAGKIEHANLSVCISDGFMEAVKNDANWDLIWQGQVKKTIRARHLWDLICTSAWESAEPGVVFMDRCNKEANTWYYESIRCVNPCVTGDTLVAVDQGRSAIPIKELAERDKDVPVLCTDLEGETRGQHVRLGRFPRLTRKNAEVWKLTLSDESTFRATPDHKMILANGDTRQLKDLHSGDVLHSFSSSLTSNLRYKEVVSIEPDGYEDVYNITVDDFHTVGYVTKESEGSGIFTLNCGEQPLPFWGVCNLGALNLSSFVKDGTMDWEQLARISKIAMRFLDNVIDATEYFIDDNQEAQLGTRRTGLGTMGLADALIKMKVPYGSEESLPIIESIYATIRDAAYEASTDIAAEKGPFPKFDRDKYMQGKFIKRLPKQLQSKIEKQGIRNAVLLTQAPTGTTSLFAGVSSGIEPVYDFAMIRRDRTGEHILYHPLLQAWRDDHPDQPTPDYFVSSKDLTPEEHVRVQAMVQRYTDSSISKTVNAPNDHTVEQVQKLYRLAYEMGCKGVTYYRDGSRDAVLTRVEDEKKAAATQTQEIEMVTSIHQGIRQRPAVVQGYTRQVTAPEGKVNVTINSDEQGPFEVFVNVGKAGSDIAALSEALGRLISLNLQILSPLSPVDRAEEISKQLRGIGGSRSVGFGVQQVRSLPDAVARALELHIEAAQEATGDQHNGHTQTNNNSQQLPTSANLQPLKVTGNLCSQCGCNTMVYEEGCKKCYSCGYSEC